MFVAIDETCTPNDTLTAFNINVLAATLDAKAESLIQALC